ncbi:MAG: thiamine pyrophosphate-binding protein [Fimbriiglobus sp.]
MNAIRRIRGTVMDLSLSRRGLFHGAAVAGGVVAAALTPGTSEARVGDRSLRRDGWVAGRHTGAQAVAEALKQQAVEVVFGIPGAQENELWDELKGRGVPYLLTAHEFGAACMADGYARATGRVGVLAVVPGPGITNASTGLGEALLDSSPIVAIVGDVAGGDKYRPFQVHSLNSCELLKPVTKAVFPVTDVGQIVATIQRAFALAEEGEPGPVAVVIPYPLFIDVAEFRCPPPADAAVPFDEAAFQAAVALLRDRKNRVGIYAGYGCMDISAELAAAAELLQAPVATSVSGRGVIPDSHPLAVGWGYGPHGSPVAERTFRPDPLHPFRSGVNCLLAVGVKFSEVSTGFYGNPRPKTVIHVDANASNLGKVMSADVCVHADAGLFLSRLLGCGDAVRRPCDPHLVARVRKLKADHDADLCDIPAGKCGVDPLALIAALRRNLPCDALLYSDVTASEHLAAEYYGITQPRTYFNPVDNQSMGWSVPAAVGGQRAFPGRTVATLTGDGCFLMSSQELTTAGREGLPVKVFVLDDRAYHYMQMLQNAAYRRTTATLLAKLDYRSLAAGYGVGYAEIGHAGQLDDGIRSALAQPGPVLIRVATDYGKRKIRWIEAVRGRYADELSASQKARFLARIGARSVTPQADD